MDIVYPIDEDEEPKKDAPKPKIDYTFPPLAEKLMEALDGTSDTDKDPDARAKSCEELVRLLKQARESLPEEDRPPDSVIEAAERMVERIRKLERRSAAVQRKKRAGNSSEVLGFVSDTGNGPSMVNTKTGEEIPMGADSPFRIVEKALQAHPFVPPASADEKEVRRMRIGHQNLMQAATESLEMLRCPWESIVRAADYCRLWCEEVTKLTDEELGLTLEERVLFQGWVNASLVDLQAAVKYAGLVRELGELYAMKQGFLDAFLNDIANSIGGERSEFNAVTLPNLMPRK